MGSAATASVLGHGGSRQADARQVQQDDEGIPYFADDVDDIYERFYSWPLLYSMGASADMLRFAVKEYEVITRSNGEDTRNPHFPWLFPQLHNEYYSLSVPEGQAASWIPGQRIITDWHHMGEGNQLFYNIGMADPTTPEHAQRSERFAAMMIGEDPEADNYDYGLNQFRSVYTDARGPIYEVNLEQAKGFLHGGSPTRPNWKPDPMGVRVGLYPAVVEAEPDWFDRPERAAHILDVFNRLVMPGDIPHNMGATGLVTNAYLHTGDERYKQWVLRYVEGLDRPYAQQRRHHARQHRPHGEGRRTPGRSVVGRLVRLELLQGQQHRPDLDDHRCGVCPPAEWRRGVP